MFAMHRLNNSILLALLLVAVGCSSSTQQDIGATEMPESSATPWTTIGEYDAGIVTSRPNGNNGNMDFVASKHFFGAMLKCICKHYDCTVSVDPPALASKPIELTVTGDSAESVFRAIADACQLQFSVDNDGRYNLRSDKATGDSTRSIAGDTFPPWWDQ